MLIEDRDPSLGELYHLSDILMKFIKELLDSERNVTLHIFFLV